MFKNARSKLAAAGKILGSSAPSYFVECLLYNVPDGEYEEDLRQTYCNLVNWLSTVTDSELAVFVCQNEQLPLFGVGPEQWSTWQARPLINGWVGLWNDW